ncbi:unnamed protein product, partial [Symbiodinium sp. CCMP2456]
WTAGDITDSGVRSLYGDQVLELLLSSGELEAAGVWTQQEGVPVTSPATTGAVEGSALQAGLPPLPLPGFAGTLMPSEGVIAVEEDTRGTAASSGKDTGMRWD